MPGLCYSDPVIRLSFLFVALLCSAPLSPLQAVILGQIDTFQDGTTNNWANGGLNFPVNISTGGPAGAGDRFLQLTADGNGPGGKLVVFNRDQWLGDYITAGVTGIAMDLKNFGNVTLSIRLAFKQDTAFGAPGYLSTTAFSLAPSSGWQHAIFLITPATMTALGGPDPFNTFFANPAEFRIINEAGIADLNGDNVVSQLGIDNIQAVPEPSLLALSAFGLLALFVRRQPKS